MWFLKSCARCGGDVVLERDEWGWFLECLQCGYLVDLEGMAALKEEPEEITQKMLSSDSLIFSKPNRE